METIDHLSEQFEAIYHGEPWYGKSIRRVLAGIEPATAFARLQHEAHTIAELLAHMISWKQVLVNRLEKNGNPKPRQKDTFLTEGYGATPELAWKNLQQRLDDQHRQLVQLLSSMAGAPGKLPLKLIYGVMQHDIYHLGQIAMLKKALTGSGHA